MADSGPTRIAQVISLVREKNTAAVKSDMMSLLVGLGLVFAACQLNGNRLLVAMPHSEVGGRHQLPPAGFMARLGGAVVLNSCLNMFRLERACSGKRPRSRKASPVSDGQI